MEKLKHRVVKGLTQVTGKADGRNVPRSQVS